jgi:hypothetical protein
VLLVSSRRKPFFRAQDGVKQAHRHNSGVSLLMKSFWQAVGHLTDEHYTELRSKTGKQSTHEPARQRAWDLAETPAFAHDAKGTQKSGGTVRGAQKSDRIASLRLRRLKFCSKAVLPDIGCFEYQATGPLPQPSANRSTRGLRLSGNVLAARTRDGRTLMATSRCSCSSRAR